MFDPEYVRGKSAYMAGKPIDETRPERWVKGYLDAKFVADIQVRANYLRIKMLDDGTVVGIGDLMFTRAIYFDANLEGCEKRFCFSDRDLADAEFDRIKSCDTYPVGWIAKRPM